METVLKEALSKEVIEVPVPAPVEPPSQSGGIPWCGIGIGVFVVAGIAIATKFLSD